MGFRGFMRLTQTSCPEKKRHKLGFYFNKHHYLSGLERS